MKLKNIFIVKEELTDTEFKKFKNQNPGVVAFKDNINGRIYKANDMINTLNQLSATYNELNLVPLYDNNVKAQGQTISVECRHCGAPIRGDDESRYVSLSTCGECRGNY